MYIWVEGWNESDGGVWWLLIYVFFVVFCFVSKWCCNNSVLMCFGIDVVCMIRMLWMRINYVIIIVIGVNLLFMNWFDFIELIFYFDLNEVNDVVCLMLF